MHVIEPEAPTQESPEGQREVTEQLPPRTETDLQILLSQVKEVVEVCLQSALVRQPPPIFETHLDKEPKATHSKRAAELQIVVEVEVQSPLRVNTDLQVFKTEPSQERPTSQKVGYEVHVPPASNLQTPPIQLLEPKLGSQLEF